MCGVILKLFLNTINFVWNISIRPFLGVENGVEGKNIQFSSDILKDGSYYKLYTQAKSTSACGLPKGFFELV